jgi:plastocyanin
MRRIVLAALCLTALAGCGSSESASPGASATPDPTATAAGAKVVDVAMRNIKFVPPTITVKLGQTVRWTNDDSVAHTVASSKLRLASEAIRGGGRFTYRPRKRGRFPYFCTIHAGQTGVLIVG